MRKITSVAELKNAIHILEEERTVKEQAMKEQFFLTYESFKPAKLLGSTLKEMIASPYFVENILDTGIGLATGYMSRKIVVGASSNIIRKFIGYAVQAGVSNFVSKHPGTIKSIGQIIYQNIFRRKDVDSDKS
jgi:hypothetical protein